MKSYTQINTQRAALDKIRYSYIYIFELDQTKTAESSIVVLVILVTQRLASSFVSTFVSLFSEESVNNVNFDSMFSK